MSHDHYPLSPRTRKTQLPLLLRNLATDCLLRICLRGNLFTNTLPSNGCICNNILSTTPPRFRVGRSGGIAPYLTSALDGGEWSVSCPSDWKMGYGIEKHLLPLPRIEIRTLSPLLVAIATERTMEASNISVVALRDRWYDTLNVCSLFFQFTEFWPCYSWCTALLNLVLWPVTI
jgi:hypothetical protein